MTLEVDIFPEAPGRSGARDTRLTCVCPEIHGTTSGCRDGGHVVGKLAGQAGADGVFGGASLVSVDRPWWEAITWRGDEPPVTGDAPVPDLRPTPDGRVAGQAGRVRYVGHFPSSAGARQNVSGTAP